MKYLPRFVSIGARRSNDISDCQAASLHMEIQFVPHQLRIPWRLRLTMHAKPYYGNTETNNLKLKLRKLRALFQVLERKRRTERKRARPCANTKTRDRFAYFGFLRDLSIRAFLFILAFPFLFFSFLFFSFLFFLSFLFLLSFLFFLFLRLLSLLSDETLREWKNSFPILSMWKLISTRTMGIYRAFNANLLQSLMSKQNLLLRLIISDTNNISVE